MDQIIRVIAKDAPVKAMAITARDTVERARAIHDCWPVASAALGRLLMAASMMGAVLKAEDGSVNPAVDVPRKAKGKLDVGAAVGGEGDLTVIRDLGMKEPYIGSVQLVGGEIAEDIAAYFVESEQIPTACALGVLIAPDQTVQAAGGYLIQLLPGADDAVVSAVERGVARLGAVSARLDGGMEPLELLQEVLADFELEVLETTPIEYRCYCSEERVSRALISLGREELDKLIREQDGAELTCQFCDRVYRYSGDQLRALREELDKPAAPGPEGAE